MPEMDQWEYRVFTVGSFFKGVPDAELEAFLNDLGQEGWKVTGFRTIENSNKAQLIARRPLDRATRRLRSMPQF